MLVRACVVVLLTLIRMEICRADAPILVKDHGDLSRLAIEGNETFTDDQIRNALQHNLELLPHTRRLAPFFQFVEELERLVGERYRHFGFADVGVEVRYEGERDVVVVSIDEGERYLCGDIEITGVDLELSQLIRQRLTQPFLPINEIVVGVRDESTGNLEYGFNAAGNLLRKSEPRWIRGEPADFCSFARVKDSVRVMQVV